MSDTDPSDPESTASPTPGTGSRGFGVDIGGSGMKAAVVDLATGALVSERTRIATPQPSTPSAMAAVLRELVDRHAWDGPVGVAFPAIVRHGIVRSAANIDSSWLQTDADAVFTEACGRPVHMINDADAAGVAEVAFGAAKDRSGVVLVLTFGTGIGSGLFLDGQLVPNTEFGHVELDGHLAERRAAASARKRHSLSWEQWAERVDRYLAHLERLLSPDLFVLGGGVSRRADKWLPQLTIDTEVVAAGLGNNAGIVGAAMMSRVAER